MLMRRVVASASFYDEYFVENEVDYELLKDDICQRVHRARALFKDLFFVGYRIRLDDDAPQPMDMASFQNIVTTYGHRIIAHGVEEAKGGMSNLLLMCVSGGVTVNQSVVVIYRHIPVSATYSIFWFHSKEILKS